MKPAAHRKDWGVHEARDHFLVRVRKPTTRYLDELLYLRCGDDLLRSGVFPNAKEVTESFAAHRALIRMGLPLSDPEWTALVVGDGASPRTAATIAMRSQWQAVSVDPALKRWRGVRNGPEVERVKVMACRVEDVCLYAKDILPVRAVNLDVDGPVVVVSVHGHAPLQAAIDAVEPALIRAIVSIPCCVPDPAAPTLPLRHGASCRDGRSFWKFDEYEDWGIWSEKRKVRCWWMTSQ